MRRLSRLMLFRVGMLIVILLAGGIFFAKAKSAKNLARQQLLSETGFEATPGSSGGLSSAEPPGEVQGEPQIVMVTMADDINPDHTPKHATSEFIVTTENIYAVMTLQNVAKDTSLGYKRYFNNEFVNENALNPPKDNAAYLAFQWKLDDGKKRVPGSYRLVFYVNGKESQSVDYVIKE